MKKKSSDKASDSKQPPWLKNKGADKKSCDAEDDTNKAMGDDDDDEDDDDEDDDSMDKTKKSLTPDTLRKSMEILTALAEKSSETREQALGRKMAKGNITAAERAEFADLLSKSQDEEPAGEDLNKSLSEGANDEYFDAAPFLRENALLVAKSIHDLNKSINNIKGNQDQFNGALVKCLSNIGEVSARLLERMDAVENQPARVAKSQAVAQQVQQGQALEKNMMNSHENASGEQLNKSQAMDALEQLNKSSLATDHPGFSPNGESYLSAIAQYENSNYLEASMAREVAQYARAQRAS